MPKRHLLILFNTLLLITHFSISWAQPVVSADPEPTYLMEARARNGASGFEGVLFTPGDPFPGNLATQLNPVGAPAWTYNQFHNFSFQYNPSTGNAVWQIDFNRDGDFLDVEESTSSLSPSLVNYSFQYINIWMQGNTSPARTVTVENLTINGVNFGTYSSASSTPDAELFEETSGVFSTITVTGSISFSGGSGQERPRFWIRLGTLVVLPVRILEWALNPANELQTLHWTVDEESDVLFYEIQRSQDGRNFVPIGQVVARNLSGKHTYQFADNAPGNNRLFYRLKIVDKDGAFTYSSILVRDFFAGNRGFRFYPNPAKGSLEIRREESSPAILQIIHMHGKICIQKTLAAEAEKLSLEGLAPGIYLLIIKQKHGDIVERLVIQ
jgi:hypothetical protein